MIENTSLNIISAIAAFIGCITGSISLLVIISQSKFQKGKIIVTKHIDPYLSLYFNTISLDILKTYQTTYSAAIALTITNKSSYPLSIDRVYCKVKNTVINHIADVKLGSLYYPLANNTSVGITFLPSSHLPSSFNAFETRHIGICLPFFDAAVKDANLPVNIVLNIQTSRGEKHIRVQIPEYTKFMKDNYNIKDNK